MNSPTTFRILVRRLIRVTALSSLAAGRMTVIAATSNRATRSDRLATELVRLVEQLGGAFIKAGQLLGSRVDLVGVTVARALGRLHDNVEPMTASQAAGTVRRSLGHLPDEFAVALFDLPVASGSIASVYRVELGERVVALKVRRPGIGQAIQADMAILGWGAKMASRLPGLRQVPLAEIIDQIGCCLIDQLNFAREAESLAQMRAHLAEIQGVTVPAVIPELCGDGVIGMDFVEGLRHSSIEELPGWLREEETVTLVQAVYLLLFVAGFVHVDLHQGNAYFLPDGTVVLLDAGFTFQMSGTARRKFTEFFGGMIQGDGDGCADILLSTVRGAAADAEITEFRRHVSDLVVRNGGAAVGNFSLPVFCAELFNLQRRYGLYAEPEFVFPMLCLLSLEGTVKEHHPRMDFQLEAAPYVMQSLLHGDGS